MLGACLVVVGLLTWSSLQQVREKEVERFKARGAAIQNAIGDRLDRHAQVLKGAAGLFAASESIQRDEWRAYFESLDLAKRARGFHALGLHRAGGGDQHGSVSIGHPRGSDAAF